MANVTTNKSLYDKIVRFFKENPDETLTQDDIEIKFNGTLCTEDVLAQLVAEKKLCYNAGEYSAVVKKPKSKSAKKKPNHTGWRPRPPRRVAVVPEWMKTPEPPKPPAPCPSARDAQVVAKFWALARAKKSGELWGNVDTGERRIMKNYKQPERCWIPLMRSEHGTVSFATNSYTFSLDDEATAAKKFHAMRYNC